MGAFCVFGVSRSFCKQQAERKLPALNQTVAEWAARRDQLAAKMYEEEEKVVRISPEFDAPQFCEDWMAAAPGEIKLAKVMVRGPKVDKGGAVVKRNGVVCMTWHEYTGVNQFKGLVHDEA